MDEAGSLKPAPQRDHFNLNALIWSGTPIVVRESDISLIFACFLCPVHLLSTCRSPQLAKKKSEAESGQKPHFLGGGVWGAARKIRAQRVDFQTISRGRSHMTMSSFKWLP